MKPMAAVFLSAPAHPAVMSMALSATLAAAGTLLPANAQADGSRPFAGRAPRTEVVIGEPHDTYGTASLAAHVVGSYQFQTPFPPPDQELTSAGGIERFVFSTSGFFTALATVMLPNGAQVERIDLRACDTDQFAEVVLTLIPCPTPGTACTPVGQIGTGGAAMPGCNVFSTTLATPYVVNNQGPVLAVAISTGPSNATTFSAARVYYRLRVSPAPAVAAFADVPVGHPQHRFVEALAAAGITGGCGGGNYCPDTPLTRGQMAVFLATALGLHFPN